MNQASHESTKDRSRILLAIPVYNEAKYIEPVLSEVGKYARDILVVDDGSTDDTPLLLAKHQVEVIRHAVNRGYGRSITDMLRWADFDGYDWLITMDCDEQHEPAAIPEFIEAIETMDADVISGSRYLVDGRRQRHATGRPTSDQRHHHRRDQSTSGIQTDGCLLRLQGVPDLILQGVVSGHHRV